MKNRRNRACILLIVFLVSWWSRKPVAVKAEGEQFAEQLYARSAVLMDADTGRILFGKNDNEVMPMASTTKIMTALVALDKGDLDAQTTVSKEAITFSESGVSTAKLKEGDVLTLRQLLYALLTVSANDAANVIAEQIAGSQDAFVEMMNQEAQKIGATNTHFVNANGLHSEDHYTTVYDLYLMFNAAMQHEEFLQMLPPEALTEQGETK